MRPDEHDALAERQRRAQDGALRLDWQDETQGAHRGVQQSDHDLREKHPWGHATQGQQGVGLANDFLQGAVPDGGQHLTQPGGDHIPKHGEEQPGGDGGQGCRGRRAKDHREKQR